MMLITIKKMMTTMTMITMMTMMTILIRKHHFTQSNARLDDGNNNDDDDNDDDNNDNNTDNDDDDNNVYQAASVHPVQCKAGRLVPKPPACVVHHQVCQKPS